MRLKIEQRDLILIGLAKQFGIPLSRLTGDMPTEKPHVKRDKKPFPDAIDFDKGVKLIAEKMPCNIVQLSAVVEVKKSLLQSIAYGIGVQPGNIDNDSAYKIWRIYCSRRSW